MTLRLLGMSDEERLEFEQVTGIKTERIIAEVISVTQPETEAMIDTVIREVQEIIGPRGTLSKMVVGGIRINPGEGIRVFVDGTAKTTIEPDGDLFVGSDITDPAGTSLAVFVVDQVYNNEEMGFGDLLIGDNTDTFANVKYDASEGRIEFRLGQTVTIFMDTEGALTIANDAIGISFLATDPTETMYLKSTTNDDLFITNTVGGRFVILNFEETGGTSRSFSVGEDTTVPNATSIILDEGTDGEHVQFGLSTSIWGGKDGKETVFNDDSFDVNFRVESATNTHGFFIEASSEYASFFGDSTNALVILDNSAEKRLEVGADHYIPTRNASNKTTIFNEANQDMDFNIQGTTDPNLFYVDASTDRVGIGTNVPFAPLHVEGDAYIAATLTVGDLNIGAVNLDEYIQDTVGAMFTGNTETGITATYQDSDGTIDLETTAIASGSAVLGSAFTITGTAGTYQATGLSVSLPSAGTYKITANIRGRLIGNAGTAWWLHGKLRNTTDAADVANSERLIVLTATTGFQLQMTCPLDWEVTVDGADTIEVYAARNGSGTPSWTGSSIESNSSGYSTLSYIKIG